MSNVGLISMMKACEFRNNWVATYGAWILLRPAHPELPLGAMDGLPVPGFFWLGAVFYCGRIVVNEGVNKKDGWEPSVSFGIVVYVG